MQLDSNSHLALWFSPNKTTKHPNKISNPKMFVCIWKTVLNNSFVQLSIITPHQWKNWKPKIRLCFYTL